MSALSDRLAQRTAQTSYIPLSSARQGLSLASTYYNGPTLHAAGTTYASASDRTAARQARQNANDQSVANTIAGRRQAKAVADQLAAAQAREKAANDQLAAARDSFSIETPTTPNYELAVGQAPGDVAPDRTKPGKGTTIKVTTPGRPAKPGKAGAIGYADDGRGAKPAKGYAGTNSGPIKVTGGVGNTSGSAGAIGGVRGSGTYQYSYNTSLGSGRNQALKTAVSYLGTRYVLGGTGHTGIDCSGLVMAVYRQLGFKVPTHSAADQGQTGGRRNGNGMPGVRTTVNNLRPGDLVAWKDGSHIAIYAGNGKIIEAANPTRGTVLRTLWAPQSAVIGIRLTLPGDGNVGTPKRLSQAKSQTLAKKAARFG